MSDYCCAKFAHEAKHVGAFAGAGLAYAGLVTAPTGQIEQLDDGSWAVNGCCGGGCFVLDDLRFCPWCGSALPSEPHPKQAKERMK